MVYHSASERTGGHPAQSLWAAVTLGCVVSVLWTLKEELGDTGCDEVMIKYIFLLFIELFYSAYKSAVSQQVWSWSFLKLCSFAFSLLVFETTTVLSPHTPFFFCLFFPFA